MDMQLIFEFLVQLSECYPVVSDIILWFGIVWLMLCIVLNVIDFLAGVFRWDLNNKFIVVLRAFCEKCGPSLSMFSKWATKRHSSKNKTISK